MGSSNASVGEALARLARAAVRVVLVLAFALPLGLPAAGAEEAVRVGDGKATSQGAGAAGSEAVRPGAGVPAETPAGDLASLLAGMRSAPGVIAHFTETKELALLSEPLEAEGVIYFVPPDRLVRLVTRPGRSRLVVDGDQVRFEDANGSKAMDLSSSTIARRMVDSFVVLFSGDQKRLEELYRTDFSVADGTWRLRLEPRSAPLNRMIEFFELTGRGARIDRMEAAEPDGDRTLTLFGRTDADHHFDAGELAELFDPEEAS